MQVACGSLLGDDALTAAVTMHDRFQTRGEASLGKPWSPRTLVLLPVCYSTGHACAASALCPCAAWLQATSFASMWDLSVGGPLGTFKPLVVSGNLYIRVRPAWRLSCMRACASLLVFAYRPACTSISDCGWMRFLRAHTRC